MTPSPDQLTITRIFVKCDYSFIPFSGTSPHFCNPYSQSKSTTIFREALHLDVPQY